MSRILYISSEAFPLIKTGGLADVAGSLPLALKKNEQDIKLLLPAYRKILKNISKYKVLAETDYYGLSTRLLETRLPGSQLSCLLVDCPALYDRPGGPYSDENGASWHDNALRFSALCHCAVDISLGKLVSNWQPDVVHCNDWQSGLVPALLSLHDSRPATVFTVHNLAYQGNFSEQTFKDLHLPPQLWHIEGLEFYDQLSFMKGGLAYADKINTVSPNYAKEILAPENGYGFDGLLRHRKKDLSGIVNGIDRKQWNPGTDDLIHQKYNSRTLKRKTDNKTYLQNELSFETSESIPLIGMVGRMVEQKGLDIILKSLDKLLQKNLQIVMLGTGDTHYEIALAAMAEKYPKKIKVIIGYNEKLAHQIEAASDVYLMPSIFEPCGLNQLYSLRYGTLPIVSDVGGLADTVINISPQTLDNKSATGFIMKNHSSEDLIKTVERALAFYQQKNDWIQCQKNAMAFDSSWTSSADHYLKLYDQALAK